MKYPRYAVESLIKRIIEGAVVVNKSSSRLVMNGRCPVCGDSAKSKSKKRFWIHEDDDWYAVTCYNCDLRTNLIQLLKTYFPTEYDEMKAFCLEDILSGKAFIKHHTDKIDKVPQKPTSELHIFLSEFLDTHCLKLNKKVLGNDLHEKLRKYAVKKMQIRNIKEKYWKDFYFCYKGKYTWRVIIPFFDNNNLMYYFQARDINPKPLPNTEKYLTASFDDVKFPDNRIYNYHNIDKTETVYVCEGLLDSLFLDNAIGLCNANVKGLNADLIIDEIPDRIWILDNPYIDKTGYFRILDLLHRGETCFVVPRELKDCKDLNDIALKLGVYKLENSLIKNNIYKGSIDMARFKIELIGKWGV